MRKRNNLGEAPPQVQYLCKFVQLYSCNIFGRILDGEVPPQVQSNIFWKIFKCFFGGIKVQHPAIFQNSNTGPSSGWGATSRPTVEQTRFSLSFASHTKDSHTKDSLLEILYWRFSSRDSLLEIHY